MATISGDAGPAAILYLAFFTAAAAPGLPLGFALFGRNHAAGWLSGAWLGYGLTAVALWVPVELGIPSRASFLAAWVALTVIASVAWFVASPAVVLPAWTRRDTTALLLVLLIVPALAGAPFAHVGRRDEVGNQRYRAYFTADLLWHTALTAELAKFPPTPHNPYLARRRLHYYWAYFVLPAVAASGGPIVPSLTAHLLINALCAGLLFVAVVYVTAWCLVPRAGPVAAAVLLVVLAASAEGLYALFVIVKEGAPLARFRDLNVDAMTLWSFNSLTVDGLPRGLWYTPQHSAACAFGLIALIVVAGAERRHPLRAALLGGISLGLGFIFSPFPGGVFVAIYGTAALLAAASARDPRAVLPCLVAVLPVSLAIAWCLRHETFTGAGQALAFGLNRMLAHAPLATLGLALGPALVPAIAGMLTPSRGRYPAAAAVALVVGLFMFCFVTLAPEPIWIGWRAGQVILVTIPALVAHFFATQIDAGRRRAAAGVFWIALLLGLPTTLLDAWNAQDTRNRHMAPGFRWTVLVTPSQQAALAWIRDHTAAHAVVQMSIGPRGRETWTLVPTFAERRMAAGRPISLLRTDGDEYDRLSDEADTIFRATDAAEAWGKARELQVRFIYLDSVERGAFEAAAIAKFEDPRYFTAVFHSGDAAVYAVR